MSRPRQFEAEAVLEKAMTAFWSAGFEATSVQRLCEATGLGAGSLYAAFGDKRAVFLAALERYIGDTPQSFQLWTSGQKGARGLRAFFNGLVDRSCGSRTGWGCLVTNATTELAAQDAEIARLVDLHFARMEAQFAGLLEEADAAGELVAGAGRHNAAMLVCLTQGLNVLGKARPKREDLERTVDSALSVILRPGAGPRSATSSLRKIRPSPAA